MVIRPSLAAFTLVFLLACGGSRPSTESAASYEDLGPPPPPRRSPLSLLPASATIVFRGDLAALRRSGHYESVWRSAEREEAASLFAILEGTNEIWGTLIRTPEGRYLPLLVGRGLYDRDVQERVVASADRPVQIEHHGAFEVAISGPAAFALIGDHTILFGERDALQQALEAQESGDGTGPTDPRVRASMERVPFAEATLAAAMRVTDDIYRDLAVPALLRSALESGAVAVDVSERIEGTAVVRTSNAIVASAIVALLRSQLAEIRGQPEIERLGLSSALSRVRVSSTGVEAWARFDLSEDEIEAIFSALAPRLGATLAP